MQANGASKAGRGLLLRHAKALVLALFLAFGMTFATAPVGTSGVALADYSQQSAKVSRKVAKKKRYKRRYAGKRKYRKYKSSKRRSYKRSRKKKKYSRYKSRKKRYAYRKANRKSASKSRRRYKYSKRRKSKSKTRVASLRPFYAKPKARKSLSGGGVRWVASSGCLNGTLKSVVYQVAAKFGPVTVSSTCRSKGRNRRVGGAKRSWHLTGNAVDFRVHSNHRAAWAFLKRHGSIGGYKHYGGGLFHIDVGPRRTW
ncbi:MAG: D-Ala-D-Ala carboxypeptidase family metallohydrolase [Filomicrobium sp.]